ncbi:MAG TPA: hypothetical protein VKV35_00740 [Streptosporangiaceae bacterium]|nr:hypothetical protein [Streptosporangiaceae bacterium]
MTVNGEAAPPGDAPAGGEGVRAGERPSRAGRRSRRGPGGRTPPGSRAAPGGPSPSRAQRRAERGVRANARLTASTAAVLLVLLAAEGVTILRIRQLVSPHVFLGLLLVPPVLVKIGSTGYRFARYYLGSPAYRRKGPPPPLLRLLGPVVVILTVALFASGVALLFAGPGWSSRLLFMHKASFVLWFFAMAVHVLGHLAEVARLAPRDWLRRTRRDVSGAGGRQWLIAGSLVAGALLGLALLGRVGPWLATARPGH